MSGLADGAYDVYDEAEPTARKNHICAACKEVIPRGHRYARIGAVFDGEAETIKRCLRCQTIHAHLRGLDEHGELWPDEQLNCGEEYSQHWGCEPPPEIAALAFALPAELQR